MSKNNKIKNKNKNQPKPTTNQTTLVMEAFNVIGDLAFDPNEESNDDKELGWGGDDE